MKPHLSLPMPLAFALATSFGFGVVTTILAQDNTLTKPFNQYLIDDVFPKAVSETFFETGRRWRSSADDLMRDSEARRQSVSSALTAKRAEVAAAKAQLKQARADNDLVRIGMLEGIVKNEELSVDILRRLSRLAEKQHEVAEVWGHTGSAIEAFASADNGFDPFRGRRLTRPEPGQLDERLGADGYEAFTAQTRAMKDLGKAFSELGSLTEELADDRRKLLETLAKGGHVQAPR